MSPFMDIDYIPPLPVDGDDESSSTISASTITCSSPLHHDTTDDEVSSLSSSTRSTRKGVSFKDDCIEVVNFVLHRNDFTSEEKAATWYNVDEIRSIKNGVRAAVQILTHTPNAPETSDYTPRGVEDRTRENAKIKRQLKIDARAAVFFEQSIQEEDGFVDDEVLADVYYDYSQSASVKAHMIALRDEKTAKSIYHESQKTIRESFVVNVGGGFNGPIIEDPIQSRTVIASSAA
mmetsp:Transcript_97612/g.135678  ORF Transcript_97612/g.135678 Transcript_97612/m.135678 type:complete len:234 (-) Transcript_97612:42-743(-)